MSWVADLVRSTLGMKWVMATSGLLMVLFLIGHLAGNLLVFSGPEALNNYAAWLHARGAILWLARGGLVAAIAAHLVTGICLTRRERAAKPRTAAIRRRRRASTASQTMILSGMVILAFIGFHLAHLTFRVVCPEQFASLDPGDVYGMLIVSFRSLPISFFYLVSLSLLMLHLAHGTESVVQTLGWSHPKIDPLVRTGTRILVLILGSGFIAIPVAVLLGILA